MNKTREECVREFHQAFGVAIDEKPTIDLLRLCRTLIKEEAEELFAEIDKVISLLEQEQEVPNEVYIDMLKEMADIQVVLSGTSVSLHPLQKLQDAFERVCASNMSKLGEDGKPIYRDDGKVLKGPKYFKPDLSDLVQ